MSPPTHHRAFIPAAGRDWLLPLYDPLLRWLGRERAVKGALIEQAAISPGMRVLDLGCGTGTLAVALVTACPQARIHAADPDPQALAIGRRKARAAAAEVEFANANAQALPYPDAHFDRVLSSFVFHHLLPDEKRAALREVRRVLAPGGSFHLLDFGPPQKGRRSLLARWLHHGERMRENAEGRLPALMSEAGLRAARPVGRGETLFGSIAYYCAEGGDAAR